MISIRQLTLSLATLYFALLFASLLVGRWFWIYPAELERHHHIQQQQVASLQGIFQVQLESLHSRVLQLITINDISSLEAAKNLTDWPGKLNQLQLNAVITTDAKFNIKQILQLGEKLTEVEIQQSLNKLVNSQAYFINTSETDIIRIGDQSYNLIIHSLTDSDSNIEGWIIFLQQITDRTFSLVNKLSVLNVKNIPLNQKNIASIQSFDTTQVKLTQNDKRCLYSKDSVASICVSFTHYDKIPSFLNNRLIIMNAIMLFIPLGIYFFILYIFTKPINTAIGILKTNNKKGILEPLVINSLMQVKELIELKKIFNDTVKIAIDNRIELEEISNTDKLTSISNRRAFDLLFEKTWNLMCRHQRSVALCLVDIDFFKPYNDHYGHVQGDKVLHDVAQALATCAKRADELVARYGGEEFVLLAFVESEEHLQRFSEKIQNVVNKLAIPHEYSDVSNIITVSTGIVWIENSGEWLTNYTREEWLNNVDSALYEAKDKGRQQNIIKIISEQKQFDI